MTKARKPPKPAGRAAVYRLFNADGDLLYIGCTCDLAVRYRTHAKQKSWWPEVAERTEEWHEVRAVADAVEKRAIETERPKYNVLHTPLHAKVCDVGARLTAEESAAWMKTWDRNYPVPYGSMSSEMSKARTVAEIVGRARELAGG